MSFASPIALLVLAAVPLAILAQMAAQRRRRRYPVRFTAFSTLAAVADAEPPFRRHLPLALFTLALAMLAVSLARPERTVQVAVQRASVVLVTDVSRSMSATDVSPTRLEAARQAASDFLDKVPGELRVGLVTFSDVAQTLQTPTTDHAAVATWVQAGATQIHLLYADEPVIPAEGHVAVIVADHAATLAALRDAGFEPRPRTEYWGSPRAFVRCPAGHRVELMAFAPGP